MDDAAEPTIHVAALGLKEGVRIDRPEDFPDLADLKPTGFPATPPPHPRARISSRIAFSEEFVERIRRSNPGFSESGEVVITYFDGYIMRDFDDERREVRTPDGDDYALTDDGIWRELGDTHWSPFGPICCWSEAQGVAEAFLEAGTHSVGYEILADTATVRIRWNESPPGLWADMWLDSTGAVIRVIIDAALDGEAGANESWLIWDVESLDPQDIGPLPPVP